MVVPGTVSCFGPLWLYQSEQVTVIKLPQTSLEVNGISSVFLGLVEDLLYCGYTCAWSII